jgi:ssDNA-binding Zn-finger/Zn-ribbon topoisomerase 1
MLLFRKIQGGIHMICPKCESNNVLVTNETKVKTKHRGCIGWLFWITLAIFTFGLILIIPAITNSKTKTKNRTVAICQNCGHRWYP